MLSTRFTARLFSSNRSALTGTVKTYNDKKGFGFITSDEGKEHFVHFKEIQGEGFKVLRPGMRVKFFEEESNGKVQATKVTNVDGTSVVNPLTLRKTN